MISSNKKEVKDGEEVNQGKVPTLVVVVASTLAAIAPVLVVRSDSNVADDLNFLLILSVVRE